MGLITRNIIIAKRDFDKKLYFKEDILQLIEQLSVSIDKKTTDREQTLRSKIISMLERHGIECERTYTPKQYLQALDSGDVPSISTVNRYCWEELKKLNTAYKRPGEYMERLVCNLVSDEYNTPGSSVRLKILKQMLGKLDRLFDTRFYSERLNDIIEREYDGIIADIDEEIFEKYLTPGHRVEPCKALRVLLDCYGDILYGKDEYDPKLGELVGRFSPAMKNTTACAQLSFIRNNNPEEIKEGEKSRVVYNIRDFDAQLVSDIKNHLEDVVKAYKNRYDDGISGIEKLKNRAEQLLEIAAFIRTMNIVDKIECDSFLRLADNLAADEENSASPRAFAKADTDMIKTLRKFKTSRIQQYDKGIDNIKDRCEPPAILTVCDALAKGNYRKNDEMKEILYLFAFAFDMHWQEGDGFRDVKKNLFEDFFCDNITRYIKDYQKLGVYDEPTGVTVQYKNFVEIVYLYWLNKNDVALTPCKKLSEAINMIRDIVDRRRTAEKNAAKTLVRPGKKYFEAVRTAGRKDKGTLVYRNYFEGVEDNFGGERSVDIFAMDTQMFSKFILDNYDIDTKIHYKGSKSAEAFKNEDSQERAGIEFDLLMKKIRKSMHVSLDNICFTLDFYRESDENYILSGINGDDDKNLMSLIEKINGQMKAMFLNGDDRVTRTRLMYLYYNWFIYKNIEDDYKETFDDFCSEYIGNLDEILDASSYQLFSDKNLIDVILLYSAFIQLRTEDTV